MAMGRVGYGYCLPNPLPRLLNISPYPYPIPDGFEFIVPSPYPSGISWCKLFTLEESRELRSFKCVRPLGYSSDGNKVLLKHNRKRLCWYDLRKKEEVADFRMRTSQVESNDGSATVAAPGESVTESLKTNCEMCLILIVVIGWLHAPVGE
ncbi:F-box protein CPR1 [Glycine soja]